MFSRFFSLLFGFESGDDRTIKTLKVFTGVAQALFVIMLFAYCLYPVLFAYLYPLRMLK